ncbi:hypothetical protein F5Y00DRAFT_38218 [Daldinia vernicosa]|uniref:uncharacterized protein n=1 Tax=Daldinia vernicosa TaxID=114800 RepID=UPI002007BD0C|nr:uncharacterized protein F5Y00DRAFT_38218 [Daldinia vernicosa]KAI0850454.1 hypothetical protein F5Y00DRAFT_38218 [Daldinia vernicosa]
MINFRLRSHNIQGRTVPPNFRLGKTVSVSRKDVIYHSAFDGMSYEEVQLEIARQSLLSVNQRTVNRLVATSITEGTDATGPRPVSGRTSLRNKSSGDVNSTLGAGWDRANLSIGAIEPNNVVVSTLQDSGQGTTTNEYEIREERLETSAHTPARVDGRGLTPLKANKEKSSVRRSQGCNRLV